MTSLFLFEERINKTIWRLTAGVRSFDFAQDDIGRDGMDAGGMVLEGLGWMQGEGD